MSRFDYVKFDEKSVKDITSIKSMFEILELNIVSTLEPGRARALALTSLEEAYMWVGKAVRDTQVERGDSTPQEDRIATEGQPQFSKDLQDSKDRP